MLATFLIVLAEGGWVASHLLYWETLSHLSGHPGCLLGRLLEPQLLEVQSAPLTRWKVLWSALKRYMEMALLRAGIPDTIMTRGSISGQKSLFFLSHRYAWPS